MGTRNKPVILFIAEAVTLAHFARIVTLAKALDPSKYTVVVASDPRYANLEPSLPFTFYPIWSVPSAEFGQALARGKPVYRLQTLTRYVEDDLALLDRVKPNLVVGDFRLSLAVSAPLRKIPYAAVVNAYWSPYADIAYPVPDISMTRVLGVALAQKLFDVVRPIAFALHAHPLNQLRRRYGLPRLGHDLRTVYTWGNYTLYADVPELVPMRPLPGNHRHLGPPLWSASIPLPDWWDRLPEHKPIVLLTLGSSGHVDLLPMLLSVLSELPITVIVATAGAIDLDLPDNAFVARYLPLRKVIERSSLIICNGGSLTVYEALFSGVPILGICSNMDQLLNMSVAQRWGAGLSLRAADVLPAQLKEAISSLLETATFAETARHVGERFRQVDAGHRFRAFVSEALE